jgi:hypothetical protein
MTARIGAAVVAAIALAGVTGACGGDDGGPSPSELIAQSAERTGEIQSFHFTLDVQNVPTAAAGLQLTAAEGDVVVPDRASADVSGSFAGLPITTQVIAVGEDVWLKNPLTDGWQKIDVSTTPVALLSPSQGVLAVMGGITDVVEEGREEVDGTTLVQVSGRVDAADVAPLVAVTPGEGTVEAALWIGADDLLLRRIEVRGAVADGEPESALRIVDLSRFDEPVAVEPPEVSG